MLLIMATNKNTDKSGAKSRQTITADALIKKSMAQLADKLMALKQDPSKYAAPKKKK